MRDVRDAENIPTANQVERGADIILLEGFDTSLRDDPYFSQYAAFCLYVKGIL